MQFSGSSYKYFADWKEVYHYGLTPKELQLKYPCRFLSLRQFCFLSASAQHLVCRASALRIKTQRRAHSHARHNANQPKPNRLKKFSANVVRKLMNLVLRKFQNFLRPENNFIFQQPSSLCSVHLHKFYFSRICPSLASLQVNIYEKRRFIKIFACGKKVLLKAVKKLPSVAPSQFIQFVLKERPCWGAYKNYC